jgi:hypothetical protein
MSSKTAQIKDYVNSLINNTIKLDMLEFFNEVNNGIFNIDITFMEYFLDLCNKNDEYCVSQDKLQEYGVLTNINTSKDIKRTLERLGLEDIEDYRLGHVAQQDLEKKHGGSNKNVYFLKPGAFKLCLIRSKNSKVYAKYYILLEIVFHFYNEYQIGYKNKILNMKDEKIDNLQNDLKTVINLAKQQNVKLGEMHEDLIETKETVKRLEIKVDELIKLINKFLSGQIDLIYTFKDNIQDTKVLIIYKLQNIDDNSKYNLVLRYAGLSQISKSINEFTKKKVNKDFKIVSFKTIGTIQQNMITIQQIYKSLDSIDSLNKQTLQSLSNDECEILTNKIFNVIEKNKFDTFENNMQSNEILRDHVDSLKHLRKLDNKFNEEIVNVFDNYMKEKLFDNKSFRVNKLCIDLQKIYFNYKI